MQKVGDVDLILVLLVICIGKYIGTLIERRNVSQDQSMFSSVWSRSSYLKKLAAVSKEIVYDEKTGLGTCASSFVCSVA